MSVILDFSELLDSGIKLERRNQAHDEFLFGLYSETRQDEMKLLSWNPEQTNIFLLHQFQAQHSHYFSKFPNGEFLVIMLHDVPIGRLYLAELDDEIRIIDITIIDKFRGRSIGSRLIREILKNAESKNKPVRIYLEMTNRSLKLFSRLGFAMKVDEGFYQLWQTK